jgi:hypothetical protein
MHDGFVKSNLVLLACSTTRLQRGMIRDVVSLLSNKSGSSEFVFPSRFPFFFLLSFMLASESIGMSKRRERDKKMELDLGKKRVNS